MLCAIAFFWVVGCQKENTPIIETSLQSNIADSECSKEYNCKTLDCLLNAQTSFESSKEEDAMVFHVGNAFQTVMTNGFYETIFMNQDMNSVNLSIMDLCVHYPSFKVEINNAIRASINEYSIYPKGYNDILASNYSNIGFDLIAAIEELLEQSHPNNQLTCYNLEELGLKNNSKIANFGIDISIPCEDLALVFINSTPTLISESSAIASELPLLFIGLQRKSIDIVVSRWADEAVELSKWYHHGRVDWEGCEGSDCTVRYEWNSKYRWYSGWKFKESGTLSKLGDSDSFYYEHYRIKCRMWVGTVPNVSVWQKHWDWTPSWSQVF